MYDQWELRCTAQPKGTRSSCRASYNVAVLGALVTLTGAVRIGSIEMVLAERFPAAHHEGNLRALHLGVELAEPLLD